MSLANYAIAVIASSNRWQELTILIDSLPLIKYSGLYIGNVGLTEEHSRKLEQMGHKIINLGYSNIGKGPTDEVYHALISKRVPFLHEVYGLHRGPIIQMDIDTEFIRDDFHHLDTTKDATVCTRDKNGPNCGVMFWHNPEKCIPFWDTWKVQWQNDVQKRCPEQDCFIKALKICQIEWQELHCRYYNCTQLSWVNKETSIIHYKGKEKARQQMKRVCAAF